MRRSTDRILTTHVGALPAPHDVWGKVDVDENRLREAVTEVVDRQRAAGVDFINEGELTKGGHWTEYLAARLGGYEPAGHPGALGELLLGSTDWVEFRDFYLAVLQNGTLFEQSGAAQHVPEGAEDTTQTVEDWVAAEPLHYRGQAALDREIAVMKAALGDTPASDAFLTTTAPLSVEPGRVKGIYASDEEHIHAIAEAMKGKPPRAIPNPPRFLRLSGLEPFTLTPEIPFVNVGERTNVTGSAKFKKLIKDGDYDTALSVAAQQVENGAQVIDINMDEGMIDGVAAMRRFVRLVSSEPDICRVPVMIDSSKWEVIEEGLKNVQGKAIVNSISLKEGEEPFVRHARLCRKYGASVIVMAFDEQGQADTLERRKQICRRAADLRRSRCRVARTRRRRGAQPS